VFGGAAILTAGLFYLDADLDPPRGSMRVVLWPANVLLWATSPGVQLTNGRYEWTPVQDLAMWVGYGVSWAFWLIVVWILWSRVRRRYAR
jgi:hypothetical protein